MRRIVLLSLVVLLAGEASAQRRGGIIGHGFGRGGFALNRARAVIPYGFGYGYLPYDTGASYAYPPPPIVFVQQPPPPPAVEPPPPEVHPVVTNYTWPAHTPSASAEGELPPFGIVLRNGSTLAAVTVVAAGDALQVVDQDERHLRLSMREVDRAATLKLNRERGLRLYLPAAQ
jgi:hypothetical protein